MRNSVYIISLIVLFSLHTHVFGAEEDVVKDRNSEISLGIIGFSSVAADTVYAYLYKTPVLGGLSVGYTYRNAFTEHGITLRGGIGRLYSPYASTPNYPSLDDIAFQFRSSYTGVFNVYTGRALSFFIGAGLHFSGNVWIPDNLDYDVLRYTWLLHSGGGLDFLLRWAMNEKHHLKVNWYVPMLGVAWRPRYSGYTLREESMLETESVVSVLFSNPSFVSFHNFISSDLRVSYEYRISTLLTLVLEYYGIIEYIFIPRDRMEIQSNVNVGVLFRL